MRITHLISDFDPVSGIKIYVYNLTKLLVEEFKAQAKEAGTGATMQQLQSTLQPLLQERTQEWLQHRPEKNSQRRLA